MLYIIILSSFAYNTLYYYFMLFVQLIHSAMCITIYLIIVVGRLYSVNQQAHYLWKLVQFQSHIIVSII